MLRKTKMKRIRYKRDTNVKINNRLLTEFKGIVSKCVHLKNEEKWNKCNPC